MSQRRVASLALALAFAASPSAASAATQTLKGTFAFSPGKVAKKKGRRVVTGTYFRMIYPKGSIKKGPFFKNPDSTAAGKTYTLLKPGIDGGLRTTVFQEAPTPPFAGNGFALANRIITPTSFAGIKFSLSTAAKDAQSGKPVGAPSIKLSGHRLSGDVSSFTASWNSIWFNQGAPKPGGTTPGLTRRLTGTYDPRTKAYTITWVSQIVGGPFNDFSGFWHLQGRFQPGKVG